MLFASDLDQTLIYSPKAFRLLAGVAVPAMQVVEVYEGRDISFMANHVVQQLCALPAAISFIPVTTRTILQYQRISLLQNSIRPCYAVVSNGGNILVNGVVDQAWNSHIIEKVVQECLPVQLVLEHFTKLEPDSWASTIKMADQLFAYCVVERDQVPLTAIADFSKWAQEQNWSVSLQGRKLYFVPKVVNKWDALAHIKKLCDETFVVAAGDSLLDLCMLEQADRAIAPCHGEIWDSYSAGALSNATILFTKQAGILAADEILEYVKICARDSSQKTVGVN